MSRPRGLPKTGGRKIGSVNKRTLILKDQLQALGCDLPKKLLALLPRLSPKEQADVYLELMEYVAPRLKSIEHSGTDGQPIQIRESRAQIKAIISNPEGLAAVLKLEEVISAKSTSDDN